jgi:hypothetical protein
MDGFADWAWKAILVWLSLLLMVDIALSRYVSWRESEMLKMENEDDD